MGKATGFMEIARVENPYRDAEARLCDFEDLHMTQPTDARRAQASRTLSDGKKYEKNGKFSTQGLHFLKKRLCSFFQAIVPTNEASLES